MGKSIEEEFKDAAEKIIKSNLKLDDDTKLSLYGYYKQATEGDCNIPEPNFWDLKGKAKYQAWVNHKGMEKENAMKKYTKKVKKLFEENKN